MVGLLNIISKYKIKFNPNKLANKSIYFEQKILKEYVGIQDQISASLGGFNKISIKRNGKFNIKKINSRESLKELNKNLVLVFTGINRTASEIAGNYVSSLNTLKENQMIEIMSQVDEGEKLLKSNHLNEFGKLLNESWLYKKSLSNIISNKKIDELYNYFMKKGALGGKLLGAGGGGFMVFYLPISKQKKLLLKTKN